MATASQLPDGLSVAIVTRYPPLGLTHSGRGISAYSRKLAEQLSAAGVATHVIADQRDGGEEHYEENSVHVHRVWRGDSRVTRDVITTLADIDVSLVHLQYELFMFGP